MSSVSPTIIRQHDHAFPSPPKTEGVAQIQSAITLENLASVPMFEGSESLLWLESKGDTWYGDPRGHEEIESSPAVPDPVSTPETPITEYFFVPESFFLTPKPVKKTGLRFSVYQVCLSEQSPTPLPSSTWRRLSSNEIFEPVIATWKQKSFDGRYMNRTFRSGIGLDEKQRISWEERQVARTNELLQAEKDEASDPSIVLTALTRSDMNVLLTEMSGVTRTRWEIVKGEFDVEQVDGNQPRVRQDELPSLTNRKRKLVGSTPPKPKYDWLAEMGVLTRNGQD